MSDRIRNSELEGKLTDEESAVRKHIITAHSIAFGGMGGQSVPKLIPRAMLEQKDELDGKALTILTGGGGTASFEKAMNNIDVARRYYYLSGKDFREKVNEGKAKFFDFWVGEYSHMIRRRLVPSSDGIDVTVIEVTGIGENGEIIPSLSVDTSMAMVQASKKVILEINTEKPVLRGLHDMYLSSIGEPIPITGVLDRAGKPYLTIPESKIAAIVMGNTREEEAGSYSSVSAGDLVIAERISAVVDEELSKEKFPIPLQLGAGPIASAVIEKMDREQLDIWSEIIPSRWTSFIGSKVKGISASAIYTLPGEQKYTDAFLEGYSDFGGEIILRTNEITNSSEVIARLGLIAVQQAISMDIFGAANVSHIGGKIYNGVGGSGDFTRSARTTILALSSATSNGKFSKIVPMLPNVDIPKQDIDIVVTDQGSADLRGLSPVERARLIIERCSHPNFREDLSSYLEKALKNPQHIPFEPDEAARWMK